MPIFKGQRPPSLNSVTHILKWWKLLSKKYINHMNHPLRSAFFTRNQQFFDIKKYRYWLYFSTCFLILLTIFGCNFDDVAKLTPLGLLKIKVFWNKGCYVISSVLDVTNKILLCNSNHIVHVVVSLAALAFLWEKLSKPQFCKASTWKTNFLEGCWWFKLNN